MRRRTGEALREVVPFAHLVELRLAPGRDPLAVLAETDRARLPSLVPKRYERMAASPFSFFRGAAAVMAEDLRGAASVGLPVQACGDCHVGNFGVAQSPEGNLLFDINDFDETLPGIDFTVDVRRLCASAALATFDSGDRDVEAEARHAARTAAHAYRKHMIELALLSPLDVWSKRMALSDCLAHVDDPDLRQKVDGFITKSEDPQAKNGNFLRVSSETASGPPTDWRIADKPPNLFHWPEKSDTPESLRAQEAFGDYRASLPPEVRVLVERYKLNDVAFKVVGVGSVGTFCAVGLFTTPDGATLYLQIKEASASVLTRLGGPDLFGDRHQGERVVQGQRLMQSASDVFLGWTTEPSFGRQFYVRHLKNKRLSEIAPLIQGHALGAYAKICGATLARAHARSGDAATIAGYLGEDDAFEDAMADFALRYADQTKTDHAALLASAAPGISK